jgi:hypothetical protein
LKSGTPQEKAREGKARVLLPRVGAAASKKFASVAIKTTTASNVTRL